MKKMLILLTTFSIFAIRGADYDGEYETMKSAQRCARGKTGGFQGCANIKECGFGGFYLATYSPEGLCNNCESQQYPDRFVACVFCRTPNKKFSKDTLSACHHISCEASIKKILAQSANLSNESKHEQALQIGAHRLLNRLQHTVERKYIKDFGKSSVVYDTERRARDKRKSHCGLGIYLGALLLANGNKLHVWTDTLIIDPADKKLVTDWGEAEKYLEFICKKYNVFGPETGEITLQEIPDGAVTFEEVLPRS